jgi:hypothetical protein
MQLKAPLDFLRGFFLLRTYVGGAAGALLRFSGAVETVASIWPSEPLLRHPV